MGFRVLKMGLVRLIGLSLVVFTAPLVAASSVGFDSESEYKMFDSGLVLGEGTAFQAVSVSPYSASIDYSQVVRPCIENVFCGQAYDRADSNGVESAPALDLGAAVNLVSVILGPRGTAENFARVNGAETGVGVDSLNSSSSLFSSYNNSASALVGDDFLYSKTADYISSIPEPVSLSLLGLVLMLLGSLRRKRS